MHAGGGPPAHELVTKGDDSEIVQPAPAKQRSSSLRRTLSKQASGEAPKKPCTIS